MVSGVTKIYTKDDGIVTVPRYARHEWMRFDRPASLLSKSQRAAQEAWIREQGEEAVRECKETHLVVKVWTEPGDGQKEIFFRNFFPAIGEPQYKSSMLGSVYTMLTIMCVMWELDDLLVLVDFGGWRGGWREVVERAFSYGAMGTMALLGRMLGLKAVNREYTPKHLMGTWESEKPNGKVE